MARDLRAAGDFGCWPVKNPNNVTNDAARFNPDNGGIIGFQRNDVDAAKVWAKARTAAGLNQTVTLPGLTTVAGLALDADSDVIAVRGISGMLTELSAAPANANAALAVVTPPTEQTIIAGDALLVTDCKSSSIFEVSNVTGANEIEHAAATTTTTMANGNAQAGIGATFTKGTMVGRLDVVWWFVATIDSKKGLYRLSARDALLNRGQPQLVSDLVKTLRLSYEFEATDKPSTEALVEDASKMSSGVSATTINTAVTGKTGGGWFSVRGVNVSMLVRSAKQGNATAVPYTFDSATPTTPSDRYVYLPLKMSVGVRNL